VSLTEGRTRFSQYRPDPPLHILQPIGGEWAAWCTGARADKANTMRRRRCRACTALLREGVAEEMYDQADLDSWLGSTQ
jgi:hypothetical protein